MPRDYVTLERDAQRGKLSYGTVTLYRNKGWVTDDEARELNRLIAEYQHQQVGAGAPAAAPVAVTAGKVYTIETFVEEIRANRINDGGDVDEAWRDIPELRRLCGRQQPRGKRVVTDGLDPFALRVLRYIFGKRFDGDVAEGLRIIGLCSYGDLRRIADQGAHEKRLRQLNGPFDRGLLTKATVADKTKTGLGIPVTVLDDEELTGLLAQHYNSKAYMVSSFEALEEELVGPVKRGKLESEDVRKLQKSGKLVQVPSPEVWEQDPEERRLQKLLGAEYWYLGSETPLTGEDFAVMVANHRCVQEDGTLLPDPLLDLLADRLSGDGVVLTADDLWPYFDGGRPAPGAPLPQRPQSVFHSTKLAAHFAGRLGLPADVVERNMTRHHDLADKIAASQSVIRRFFGLAEDFLEDKQEMSFGPDAALRTVIGILSGAAVGAVAVGALGLPMDKGESLLPVLAFAILGVWVMSRLRRWFGLMGSVVVTALPAGALFWTGYFISHARSVAIKRSIPAAQVTSKIMTTVPKVWVVIILVVAITLFLTRRGRR